MEFNRWFKRFKSKKRSVEIDPDEILLDSRELPHYNEHQFEGRLEKPVSRFSILATGVVFVLIIALYGVKVWGLQVAHGDYYANKSENNRLRHTLIFAERGIIYDRNNELLAWNVPSSSNLQFSLRQYKDISGISDLIGYIKYPSRDSAGFYYREDFVGLDGIEKIYNDKLGGTNGIKITETDALDNIQSESQIKPPENGSNLTLSIDSRVQSAFYDFMKQTAKDIGFSGGAGVIMDVHTGEILSIVTYPEYNSQILTDGSDKAKINAYVNDKNLPFLNRAVAGLYTPGSIIKPYVAIGALNEGVISPDKKILSTGSISIPNDYDPTQKSVFMDWRPQGWVDMRQALAVSSNVYFYEVGGGYDDQKGLGIANIEKYTRLFGFGEPVDNQFFAGPGGTIPDPEWKAQNFKDKIWRIGDTYHTAIGQYGFQVSPIQVVRAVAAIANDGFLLQPTILKNRIKSDIKGEQINLPKDDFKVIKEGMRLGALEGTGKGLNIPQVAIATKTGTAELGVTKEAVNSWVTGFFPYENPHYAFAAVMERGSSHNTIGALYVIRQLMEWMSVNTPEYLK